MAKKTKFLHCVCFFNTRTVSVAALVVAIAASFGGAFFRTTFDVRLRDGARERATRRLEIGQYRESFTKFDERDGATERRQKEVERFRNDFDDRLAAKAAAFLAERPDEDWRTVATGLARWNVDERTVQRVFSKLAPKNRGRANALFCKSEPFDFASERAATSAASRQATDVFQTFKNDKPDSNDGADAALHFLRELEGSFENSTKQEFNARSNVAFDDEFNEKLVSKINAAPFLCAFDLDSGNPLNSLGILTPSDVVSIRSNASQIAEKSLETASFLFFLFATAPFGGGFAPGSAVETFVGAAAIRRKFADFFANLDAARRCLLGVFAAFLQIFSLAILAQVPFLRRFGVDAARIDSPFDATLTSVRLLN